MSKGNASELTRIRQQMVRQKQLKEERIKSTNGAVLHSPIWTKTQSDATLGYLNTIEGSTQVMYDVSNYEIGRIDNPLSLRYTPDGECAFLRTRGWSENTSDIYGGEACANGYMSDAIENGDYYITAAEGPTGDSMIQSLLADFPFAWVNYVILWGSYNYQSMDYIGYTQVHCDDLTEIFVGLVTVHTMS